ncbi:MAG TPA: hypothetical protein PKM27_06105 [Saprospiraceae bacterium]|nr:hypothetical protein [Saprospiraceae bacterium]HNT21693.1 hypothetical protein [Saprospiraceae bacterium]
MIRSALRKFSPFKSFLALFLLNLPSGVHAQDEEIAIFNSKGKAIAFLEVSEEQTLYMWSGKPVAYLYKEGGETHIYGFNGKHLGWYEEGILYTHDGDAVGFIEGAMSLFTEFEPIKGFKRFKPSRSFREFPPFKPFFSKYFSKTPLSLFLLEGAEE